MLFCFRSDLNIIIYPPEGDPPATWWDEECDKSLLVGVYKYGECLQLGSKLQLIGSPKGLKLPLFICQSGHYISLRNEIHVLKTRGKKSCVFFPAKKCQIM